MEHISNPGNPTIPPELRHLAKEARKYGSAEEFVDSLPIVYHGTQKEFIDFDVDKRGSFTKATSGKEGVFFTSSFKTADSYRVTEEVLNSIGEGIYVKLKKLEKQGREKEAKSLWSMLSGDELKLKPKYWEMKKLGTVKEAYINFTNPLEVDMEGRSWTEDIFNQYIRQAKAEGRDGVILRNTYDANADVIDRSDIMVVFDEEDIITKKKLINLYTQINGIASKQQEHIH